MNKLIIDNQEDLTNVSASCTCGEFSFKGDWDDLSRAWDNHSRDPESAYPVTRIDHQNQLLLTRAAYETVKDLLP